MRHASPVLQSLLCASNRHSLPPLVQVDPKHRSREQAFRKCRRHLPAADRLLHRFGLYCGSAMPLASANVVRLLLLIEADAQKGRLPIYDTVSDLLVLVPRTSFGQGPWIWTVSNALACWSKSRRCCGNWEENPARIIARAGLDPDILRDPENSISFIEFGRLIETCVAETGCEHIGLLVGQRSALTNLGLVGRLMQNAPTLEGCAPRSLQESKSLCAWCRYLSADPG